LEKRNVAHLESATKLIADLKKSKAWAKMYYYFVSLLSILIFSAPTDEGIIEGLEAKLKVKLPVQLKSLLQHQNGNKQFGVESVDGITAGMLNVMQMSFFSHYFFFLVLFYQMNFLLTV
jgi:hypothetical protein